MFKWILCLILLPFHIFAMKIAVVSVAIGEKYIEDVMPGIENKSVYCNMHGYDFYCSYQSLDETRHPAWSKILLIKKILLRGTYDWIFWTDADAVICNPNIKLEDLIDENFEFIVTKDFNNINAGNFLIKCSEWSANFLDKIYNHIEYIDHPFWEQKAIVIEYEENQDVRNHSKIIPQRLMNSYCAELFQSIPISNPEEVFYQPGDFIIHFPAFGKNDLKRFLTFYSFLNNPPPL